MHIGVKYLLRSKNLFFDLVLERCLLVQSYLFTGNDLNAKYDLAKNLNLYLNCQDDSRHIKGPCEKCLNCKWILEALHPASPILLEPELDAKKKTIKISAIKKLQEILSRSSDYYRVVIFTDVSSRTLAKESANALLKLLEEKLDRVLFLLFAEYKDEVLSTISSRTQVLALNSSDNETPVNLEFRDFVERASKILNRQINSNLEIINFIDELLEFEADQLKAFFNELELYSAFCEIFDYSLINRIEAARYKLNSFVRAKPVLEDFFLVSND
jgi:DNA polymerase III gamma/tau subunit